LSESGAVKKVKMKIISEKKVRLETYIITTALISLILFGLVFEVVSYNFALPNATTITIEPNSFQTETSYIVFKEGTTIKARNGATGQIVFSGTDATAVIQSVFDDISAKGGTVFFKNGTYSINGLRLANSKTVMIIGEDVDGVVFQMRDSADGAISSESSFTERAALLIEGTGSVYLRDFMINGRCEYQTREISGILIRTCKDFRINNVYVNGTSRFGIREYVNTGEIRNCKVYNIYIHGTTPSPPPSPYYENLVAIYANGTDVIVADNKIGWVGTHAIKDNKGVGIYSGTSATINRNWIWSTRTAIYVVGNDAEITENFIEANYEVGIWVKSSDNKITDNRIRMGGTNTPVSLAAIWISGGSKNLISNNKIYNRGSSWSMQYGILENGTASNNYIIANELDVTARGSFTVAPISWSSSTTVVFNNNGFPNPLLPANALVFKDGSLIKVIDKYGSLLKSGTDPDDVINWATLNALTPGRTAKERIVVIGDYIGIDHGINIYNYTIFELVGSLKIADNLQSTTHPDVIHQASATNRRANDIEIIGGIYDGNRQNGNNLVVGSGIWNYEALNGMYFSNVTNLIIRDAIVKNAGTVGIHLDSSRNVILDNVKVYDPYFHAVHFGHDDYNTPVGNITIINSYFEGPRSRPSPSPDREADGGALAGASELGYFIVKNTIINGSYAQSISSASSGVRTEIIGNKIYNVGSHGIEAGGTYAIVESNIVYRAGLLEFQPNSNITGRAGIRVIATKSIVSNNIIEVDCTYGIYITSSNSTVTGNQITGSPQTGIYATGSKTVISGNVINIGGSGRRGIYSSGAETLISGNIIKGNLTTGINFAGSSTTVVSNIVSSLINSTNTNAIIVGGSENLIENNFVYNFERSIGIFGGSGSYTTIKGNYFCPKTYWLYITQSTTTGVIAEYNTIKQGTVSLPSGISITIRYNDGYRTENSGVVYPANNGTIVTHGLVGEPNLIILTLSGKRNFATGCYLLDPTVMAVSSTTFTIQLLYHNVTANAYYPVTPAVYNATIYWYAQYSP
jgi:parallel beta-helix repeat protein